MKKLMHFLRDEDGVVSIEYGLIGGFIALAVVASLILMKDELQTLYGSFVTSLQGANTP